MKVVKVISESKDGSRKEVIAKDTDDIRRTLHICKAYDVWKYFVGEDKKGRKVFSPIII